MPRRRAQITQSEIKRAVCATVAAGVKVYGVRVDGSAVTVLTEPVPAPQQVGEAITDAAKIEALLRNGTD
jgi:hypothetical protein